MKNISYKRGMLYFILCLTLLAVMVIPATPMLDSGRAVSSWVDETVSAVVGSGDESVLVVVKATGTLDKSWALRVQAAGKDKSTKAVVLWIESPGGFVSDARLFSHDLELVRAEIGKPIYIYTEYLLASGAYWVTCTMDSIFASPAAYVGGIGVYSWRADFTKADSMNGVQYWFFYGGKHKLWRNPHIAMSDEEAERTAIRTKETYQEFVIRVLEGRKPVFAERMAEQGLILEKLNMLRYVISLACGEIFLADEAQAMGLVDRVMYFSDLCDDLRDQGFVIKREDGSIIENFYEE